MDDDAPSTSLNPDSPPFHPPPQPFLRPPIIILPNYFTPPPSPIIISHNFPHTCPTYPLPFHPAYHHQYHSLPPPLQFSNNTHLAAPPSQWPQFQYSHYFQQQPPQEEWADHSRSIQDATTFVSVGLRMISSCPQSYVQRPEIGESSRRRGRRSDKVPQKEEQHKTTIMINRIPNEYTREKLLQFLDEHCKKENDERDNRELISAYDFVYLPFFFDSGKNRGYAFVNFTNPKAAWKFYKAFNGKPWNLFNSNSNSNDKIIIVSADNLQGKEAIVRHYEESIFDCDMDEYLPLLLEPHSDGSGNAQVTRRLLCKRRSPH